MNDVNINMIIVDATEAALTALRQGQEKLANIAEFAEKNGRRTGGEMLRGAAQRTLNEVRVTEAALKDLKTERAT